MNTELTTIVSVEQLDANLSLPNWVIIDCRFSLADTSQGESHYNQSHIPGAHYAHLDNHLSSAIIKSVTGRHPLPDANELEAQFKSWGINNDSQIVVYDDKTGGVASRLWWLSRWLGHKSCAVLDGGFNGWKNAGKTLETAPAKSPTPGDFKRSTSLTKIIEKQDVLNPEYCLLDAREAERYRGEHEPIDPVAGHIPGALNAPFMENVNADGLFHPVSDLQQRFDPIIDASNGKQLVHYCGSGVTAAHNMLAMAHAQRDPGALYVGSFSEWVSGSHNGSASNATSKNGDQFPVARLAD